MRGEPSYGLDVHHVLEHAQFLWSDDTEKFIDQCQKASINMGGTDLQRIHNVIKKYPWLLTSSKEVELLSPSGILRLDCLVEQDDGFWIVDFKTGPYTRSYDAQIKRYVKEVLALYPSKNIEGYLLWIDHENLEKICDA